MPDYTNLSMALSEVLVEIGLNDVIVKKIRRTKLLAETIKNVAAKAVGHNFWVYMFGSQCEGTTTRGLGSDVDSLFCFNDYRVIQKWREWKYSAANLLMVEAEATPPGYCMLQVLRPDAPLLETEILTEHFFKDRQGRVFLKNTFRMHCADIQVGREQHGPAYAAARGQNGEHPSDFVPAIKCTSQLPVVQHWLSQLHEPWPSEDMKKYIASSPCFVVPVGGKESDNEEIEWRISTSLAERCLMFNLNITQLQVYVLMKMLLKTNINSNVPEESHISSFMCKNVVLHCVRNTDHSFWQSHMLIQCLQLSLFTLYACVVNENCPHFIIRSNNLMAGRFTLQAKYQLQENLQRLCDDVVYRGIISLYTDDIATMLMLKVNQLMFNIKPPANVEECQVVGASILLDFALQIQGSVVASLKNNTRCLMQQYTERLEHVYRDGNAIERSVCGLLLPYFYTFLGCFLASENIQCFNTISHQAIAFMFMGLNSDAAFSKLKLASVFLSVGDIERTRIILRDLEGRYDIHVCNPVCWCTRPFQKIFPQRAEALLQLNDEFDIVKITSACVIFTQAEKNCIPKELQYEMYRSTPEDLLYRKEHFDKWMDWAVVDSLPYLYFLFYKVYGHLQRSAVQQIALYNMMLVIQTDPNLGHRETALNLLGQCYEQEKRWNDALKCYSWSLNIRPRNNVAKLHICKLLFHVIMGKNCR